MLGQRRMSGASLVEVLVSLLILGIGVLGFVALQVQSLDVVKEAYYRTQAASVAQDVIERIKANPRGWPSLYAGQQWRGSDRVQGRRCVTRVVPLLSDNGCDQPEQMVRYDHFEISSLLSVTLPDAVLEIQQFCEEGGAVACVQVRWAGDETQTNNCRTVGLTMDEISDHRCVSISFVAYQK